MDKPFQETDLHYLESTLRARSRGNKSEQILGSIVLLNLAVLLIRPQVIIPFLASAKITIVLFFIAFLCWLKRTNYTWNKITITILILVGFHAVLIFIGKAIWDPLIVNDGAAFSVWRDVVQYLFCFLFPVAVYLTDTNMFRRLTRMFSFAGFCIATYAITHAGRGPGGFLHDENDCCLMLVFLLPYPLLLFQQSKSRFYKLLNLICMGSIVAGIIITESRGGFVGLVCTFGFLFLYMRNKMGFLALCFFGALVTIPFVPQEYIKEIVSIKETDSGTAKTRFEYWGAGFKTWIDPKNFIQGVGFDNIPWRISEYQGTEYGLSKASMGGRQVHSMHIQIMADLGLLGILLLGYATTQAISGNNRCKKESIDLEKQLQAFQKRYQLLNQSEELIISTASPIGQVEKQIKALLQSQKDLIFLNSFFISLNASCVALLSAGTFISVLYYPIVWMVLIFSAAAQTHWRSLRAPIAKSIEVSSALVKT